MIHIKPKYVIRKMDGTKWVYSHPIRNQVARRDSPGCHYWRPIKRSFLRGWIVFTGPTEYFHVNGFRIPTSAE